MAMLAHDGPSVTAPPVVQSVRDALALASVAPGEGMPSQKVARLAKQLINTIIETGDQLSPAPGAQDWSASGRDSNPFFCAANNLIEETFRRAINGARRDGEDVEAAINCTLNGLLAACHLYANEAWSNQFDAAAHEGGAR